MASNQPPPPTIAQDFVAGAVGGTLECVGGFPLDTVKVRIQTADGAARVGMWSVIRGIAHREGLFAFYRGVQVSCIFF